MDLPKNEASFSIDYVGETTGHRWEGQFKCICVLSIAQKHQKELERTRLLADNKNPSEALTGIAEILSTLRVRLLDGPVWWQQSNGGSSVLDEDLLVHLYLKVKETEQSWLEQVKQKAKTLMTPTKALADVP